MRNQIRVVNITILNSIFDTTGRTPIVRLNHIAPKHVEVYAKVEAFNPGDTIIECTSGNFGIALAVVAAARGYKFVAVMGDRYSVERRKLIRAYGGKVILFPSELGSNGGNKIADELAERYGWFRSRQFDNPANPEFHRMTTASEILSDFASRRFDYFVTGFGTSGTLTGVGQMLKTVRPDVRIVTTEPANTAILQDGVWNIHEIQGLAPNFMPSVMDRTVIDELRKIDDVAARDMSRRLSSEEGIFIGISAGATVVTALEVAETASEGSVILVMMPDTGERYLSTFFFDNLNEGSDDKWLAAFESERLLEPAK
ncbi:pyridoxal-phosphate dependent enzyme [Breoghania sp.]|uniref:PLP-dependent cysteine synthase family protein n=1 Tax=Breoghania sp. TaxID=2065378 RepID=UPI0026323738|nr:pyridoxal-phosphate dependent enzyme [Breoghania sp.]MDJ0930707.1 pyridoxal-phosphate dependent enzyme [Breoghania sp.]